MIQYSIHLPRLCDRTTLAEIARLHPTRLSVTENEAPLSTAQMEVPLSDCEISVGQFVELYDARASLGFYRVAEVQRKYRAGVTQVVYLEHAVSTLANDIIFSGVTYEKGAQSARSVLTALLNRQSVKYWQLWTDAEQYSGDLSYLEQQKPEFYFEDQDLLQALLDLMATLPRDLFLVFDMTRFPWRLIPRALPKAATSEARLSRNIESLQISYDWNSLCTRLYPKGSGSGEGAITITDANPSGKPYLDADTQGRWGIISQIWTDDKSATADALYSKAVKHLEEVKNPVVSIRLDGHDLSGATGEEIDSFEVGYPCAVNIPEDGVALSLRVLTVEHPDLITDPARVTLTIGTADKRKISRQRAQQAAGGGGGGGGGGRTVTETVTISSGKSYGQTAFSIGSFTIGSSWKSVQAVTAAIRYSAASGDPSFDLYADASRLVRTITQDGSVALLSYLTYSGGEVARGTHTIYGQNAAAVGGYDLTVVITIKGVKSGVS